MSLCNDADQRLGSKPGAQDIKNHRFFYDLDWEHIRDRRAPNPVHVKSIDDTSNFDEFPAEDLAWSKLPEKSEMTNGKDWVFLNYTFKRFQGLTKRGVKSVLGQGSIETPSLQDA